MLPPEMIDWWFDNMEKGFALWHPSDHKGFEWEISPAKVGHVGAVQLTTQPNRAIKVPNLRLI
jgi:hypothetical protein